MPRLASLLSIYLHSVRTIYDTKEHLIYSRSNWLSQALAELFD